MFQSFLCWIIIYHQAVQIYPHRDRCPFQSFLCWIIIYHQFARLIVASSFIVSILLMLDNNLSPYSSDCRRWIWLVSILLMLDNNLSPAFNMYYRAVIDLVSILLMLDNNLSPPSLWPAGHSLNLFQSFLCWIIIYHLGSNVWFKTTNSCFNPSYAG